MKTTVDIADPLFEEAKAAAREDGTTFRAVIEQGLRLFLASRKEVTPTQIPDARFGGDGLQPEFRNGDWSQIRDAAYEGHGS